MTSEKRGQYVWYSMERENLSAAVASFLKMIGADAAVTFAPRDGATSPPAQRRSPGRIDRPDKRA